MILNTKFLVTLLLTTICLLPVTVLQAADGATLYQQKGCITCHGPQGDQPIGPNFPKLAGQNKGYLLQQIKDIKSGARNNGLTAQMKGIVANVSDEDIQAIVEYLSGL